VLKRYLICISNLISVEAASQQEAQNKAITEAVDQNYWLAEILEEEEVEIARFHHDNGEYIETEPFCLPTVGADSDYRTHSPSSDELTALAEWKQRE